MLIKSFKTSRDNTEGRFVVVGEPEEFADALRRYHKKRVLELVDLGWINDTPLR